MKFSRALRIGFLLITTRGAKLFSLFTEIDNVMNRTYYYSDGLPAPPRTWKLGINIKI